MDISLAAESIFHIGNFPVTNTLLIALAIGALFFVASLFLKKKLRMVPGGFQNLIEYIFEALLDLIDSVTQNKEETKKFFPIVASIFLFVIASNWIELAPGLGTVGINEVHGGKTVLIPFLRSSSADLNVTLALAIVSVFSIQFMGIAAIGAAKYAKKFFVSPLHKPYMIGTFVGLLELLGEIAKIISFSFRLFGNIFAGEVLLLVMLNFVPYIVPIPFLMLELFVGFIQALVFSMLTLVFLKIAVTEAHH